MLITAGKESVAVYQQESLAVLITAGKSGCADNSRLTATAFWPLKGTDLLYKSLAGDGTHRCFTCVLSVSVAVTSVFPVAPLVSLCQ